MTVLEPRSLRELKLYVRLQRCPRCGSQLDLKGLTRIDLERHDDGLWSQRLVGPCPGCKNEVELALRAPGVWPSLPAYTFGATGPSTIITREQFIEEADAHIAALAEDPARLESSDYFADRDRILEAMSLIEEAQLFTPDDPDLQTKLDELRAHLERLDQLLPAHQRRVPPSPSRTEITRPMVEAHRAWQLGGRTGEGRMVLQGATAAGGRLGNSMLAEARLTSCDFSNADLSFSNFGLAELRDCSFERALLSSTIFDQVQLDGCDFRRAALGLANFRRAVIGETDFRECSLERGELTRCRATRSNFRHASLLDAVLDEAVFEDCDFRDVDLARKQPALQLATTRATRFIRCDFRGANFEGRRLKSTAFVDCKFAGVLGRPVIEDVYLVQRPDFSIEGDGSDVRDADAVFALWGKAGS